MVEFFGWYAHAYATCLASLFSAHEASLCIRSGWRYSHPLRIIEARARTVLAADRREHTECISVCIRIVWRVAYFHRCVGVVTYLPKPHLTTSAFGNIICRRLIAGIGTQPLFLHLAIIVSPSGECLTKEHY